MQHDLISWRCHTRVDKYESDEERAAAWLGEAFPYETIEVDGNLVLNAGINRIVSLIIGAGGQAFDATHARLGVGTDSAASVNTQTDLNPVTGGSKYWRTMDATFPKLTASTPNAMQFQSTFGATDAIFAWNEWGIDNGTAVGATVTAPLLNRKNESLGTKTGGSWVLTVTISLS